ncbi:redox-regulated ATPase YchF [Patescibacteria group bacterium]
MKVGIIGLPNAGKSTLFNALMKKQVADMAPYPFCTIEPNVGVVSVPDERLEKIAQITRDEENMDKVPQIVPAIIEFVDIAGLVKGASVGEGLGNKFLSHIREVDIICHVVRLFEDSSVVHGSDVIDPVEDIKTVETELILADLQTLDKQAEPKGYTAQTDKDQKLRWELICKLKDGLNQGKKATDVLTSSGDIELVKSLHLLTFKPTEYVLNASEQQLNNKIDCQKIIGKECLVVSAKTELELVALDQKDQVEYLKELGLKASGLDRLIRKSYQTLELISFLTCNKNQVHAWTIKIGTKAQNAAGVVHTDFEKNFIVADTISFDNFTKYGGWKKCRLLGKVRQEGREYIVSDGDLMDFKAGK